MKINYGSNTLIEFKYLFLLVILLVLMSEHMFYDMVFGEIKDGDPLPINLEKILPPLAVVASLIGFFKFSPFMRNMVFVCFLYLIFLMFESYFQYSTYFVYPHVFAKIMTSFVIFFVYVFFKNEKQFALGKIAYMILVAFIIDLAFFKTEVLSFSAFVNTERGFSASSTYLLLLSALYFFIKYIEDGKMHNLFIFFFELSFVVFLQHRSVWIASSVALVISFILIFTKTKYKVAPKLVPVFLIPIVGIFLVGTFLFIDNPEITKTFERRFGEIGNYKSEGTGSWRYEQFISYLPFIEEKLITGNRFKGFELPIQFYHPSAGIPFFNDGTGHHFHSFYIDKLFYLGILGLLIVLTPFFYYYYLLFTKKHLTTQQIVLTAYITSGLFYGISYNWPIAFYGILGLAFAFMEQEDEEEEETVVEPINIELSKPAIKFPTKEFV